ncbi:MAG: pyridoxal 5'-phosphate synthase glutaminase subunit PdxT [Candidatus Rokubacteria bacterium]|nr:pyridoxal 5'-phosphate synthase glutaminase subunit PdxT [Candidatus Rokubacteria bacterium]
MKIGVLALQGDFALHAKALERCARDGEEPIDVVEVRKPEQLDTIDGLIMPGGESTTLLKLMETWGFVPALEKFHAARKPIFGTCAGLILLARDVENPKQFSLGLIDVGVERNAYGRQRESFEAEGRADLDRPDIPVEMVFIRAPRIVRLGPGVQPLARQGDETVMVRQGTVLVATFHPELTDDASIHRYFCDMVRSGRTTNGARR